jgi:Fis family transcriptional regulator, factor for inversion stimulation protein
MPSGTRNPWRRTVDNRQQEGTGTVNLRTFTETEAGDPAVYGTHHSEPLRVCVYESLQGYFQQMGGHEIRGLYQLILSEVEEPLLRAVLEHTRGNQTRAAGVLGISRSTLRKKLADYKLG